MKERLPTISEIKRATVVRGEQPPALREGHPREALQHPGAGRVPD